jgi:hypothetical protein
VKRTFYILPALVAAFLIVSCKKEKQQQPGPVPVSGRTVKFILYTNKDFSQNTDSIYFSLSIHNQSKSIAFDSVLAARSIKDIPNKANALVFSKTVPDDGSILLAGFFYTIKNVGSSWSLDTVGAHEKIKVIEYPFQ